MKKYEISSEQNKIYKKSTKIGFLLENI